MVRYLFYTIGDLTYQSPLVSPPDLPQPTEEDWKKTAEDFILYSSSLTALEILRAKSMKYKHRMTVAPFSLTIKRTFSVVLMALLDANCKFTIIDVSG